MTIIFSALAAVIVHPLVKRIENLGASLPVASGIVVVGVAILMAAVFGFFAYEGSKIVSNLPSDKVEKTVEDPVATINGEIDLNLYKYPEELKTILKKSKSTVMKFTISSISSMNATISFLLSCPIFIFFMLISRKQIRTFYYSSFKKKNRHIANRILEQIELAYTGYVRGMVYVMAIISVLTAIGLFALGIPHAIYLGLLAGLLTIVPYFGVIISALIPVIIALLTKDSLWYAVGVVGVFAIVQFVEGNIITPKIMGDQVGINPLTVILGIIIFGAIGGILGMVLTIPILALIKIIANYMPGWKPIGYLLRAK